MVGHHAVPESVPLYTRHRSCLSSPRWWVQTQRQSSSRTSTVLQEGMGLGGWDQRRGKGTQGRRRVRRCCRWVEWGKMPPFLFFCLLPKECQTHRLVNPTQRACDFDEHLIVCSTLRRTSTSTCTLHSVSILYQDQGSLTYCWWECKLGQSLGRAVWWFLKRLKLELPYDPAVPLLGIYPEKNTIWKDTWTPMFTAALFTIDKTGKWPKYPSTDEWRKCGTYIQWNITQL